MNSKLQMLPFDERIKLVEDLWDSIASDQQALALTTEQRAELDRRLDAYEFDRIAGSWRQTQSPVFAVVCDIQGPHPPRGGAGHERGGLLVREAPARTGAGISRRGSRCLHATWRDSTRLRTDLSICSPRTAAPLPILLCFIFLQRTWCWSSASCMAVAPAPLDARCLTAESGFQVRVYADRRRGEELGILTHVGQRHAI